MQEERAPFYFLDKTINILVVDDDKSILSLIKDILSPIKIYSVISATTIHEAETALSSPDRTNLCVLDLGITHEKHDEFYLLKKYVSRVSFVILTGATSPVKGFTAHKLGAKDIVEKSSVFDSTKFLKTVNHYSLLNIINPRYGMSNDTLTLSTNMLFKESPKFVSQWAIHMGISDRELRHIWTKNLGANAKIILSIYQIFEAAFHYYERRVSNADAYQNRPLQSQDTYKRLEEYFHCHKSTITDFIAFGNVVPFVRLDVL